MNFTDDQAERYARHILLPEVGGSGQYKLMQSSVLILGAGGLGSPVAMYLAAAGVGKIGIVDDDVVDLSNLQRQILHTTAQLGAAKVISAKEAVKALNPEVMVIAHQERLESRNVERLIADYDLVVDGSDNFDTRFLINDACFFANKPLVSGAILRFEGQISTYKSYLGKAYHCYRCIFPTPPPPGVIPSCSEAGVFGALAGIVGSTQAMEALKELLGIGKSLAGYILIYDGLDIRWRKVKVHSDPSCPLCGVKATIHDLAKHGL